MRGRQLSPDWCKNVLHVSGRDVRDFVLAARGLDRHYKDAPPPPVLELSFHALRPVPDAVLLTDDGYDWEVQHWGCAWGATDIKVIIAEHDYAQYRFDTPYQAPFHLLDNITGNFPLLVFKLQWAVVAEMCAGEVVWVRNERMNQRTWIMEEKDLCRVCHEPLCLGCKSISPEL